MDDLLVALKLATYCLLDVGFYSDGYSCGFSEANTKQ
jgi:hypothetical protein